MASKNNLTFKHHAALTVKIRPQAMMQSPPTVKVSLSLWLGLHAPAGARRSATALFLVLCNLLEQLIRVLLQTLFRVFAWKQKIHWKTKSNCSKLQPQPRGKCKLFLHFQPWIVPKRFRIDYMAHCKNTKLFKAADPKTLRTSPCVCWDHIKYLTAVRTHLLDGICIMDRR